MYNAILPLPKDTAQAAQAAFGQRHPYVRVGQMALELIADCPLQELYRPNEVSPGLPEQLCLATIFQFLEGLSDRQAEVATRARIDWKYALHLPMTHPGLRALALCDFRQRLRSHPDGQSWFQCVVTRFQDSSVLLESLLRESQPDRMLQCICVRTRLELITAAMHGAVEALVVLRNEWLRTIMLPHWYQRYTREQTHLDLPEDLDGLMQAAESIGEDGRHLLTTLEATHDPELAALAAIRQLNLVWDSQFDATGRFCWQPADCSLCMARLR